MIMGHTAGTSLSHHAAAIFFSFCLRARTPPRFRGFLAAAAPSPRLAAASAGAAAAPSALPASCGEWDAHGAEDV